MRKEVNIINLMYSVYWTMQVYSVLMAVIQQYIPYRHSVQIAPVHKQLFNSTFRTDIVYR